MFAGFLGSFAPLPGGTSRYTSLKEDGHEQVGLAGGGLRAWSTGPFLLDGAAPITMALFPPLSTPSTQASEQEMPEVDTLRILVVGPELIAQLSG